MDRSIRLLQDGSDVLLIVNGVCVAQIPWEAAITIGKNMVGVAKTAEEFAHKDSIIADQALLTRVGAGFGLTNNVKLQEEAKQMAAWDKKMRTIPADYRGKPGTPSVSQTPANQSISLQGIDTHEKFGKVGG